MAPRSAELSVTNLGVDYGGGEVVTGLSIDVFPGEIFAMIGPNGSGKSSTLNSLVGLAPKSRGRVVVGNTDVSRAPTSKIVAAGLVLVPEDRGLFPSMTVRDHLWLASRVRPPGERFDRAFDLFPILSTRQRQNAGSLSGGEAQMLSIAVGLLLNPTILLIDEMSFGLAPRVVESLLETCRKLSTELGITLVIVEQFVDLILQVADRAAIVVDGTVRLAGSAKDLAMNRDRLQAAYFGLPEEP